MVVSLDAAWEQFKDIVACLNAALEDGEPAVLLEALRNVAKAKGGMGACPRGLGRRVVEIRFCWVSLRSTQPAFFQKNLDPGFHRDDGKGPRERCGLVAVRVIARFAPSGKRVHAVM